MVTTANIKVEDVPENASVKVVNLSGELDESNLPEFEGAINPLVQDLNNKTLILNLKGLEFISSKAIGYLASIYTTLNRTQRKMVLTDFNQTIKDILTLVGLDQIITTYPTLEEALQSMTPKQPITQ